MQFLSTLLFISGAAASIIACRGSAVCGSDPGASVQTIHDQVQSLVANGGASKKFETNQQIACSQTTDQSFCAFYTNGGSGTAQNALQQLQNLMNHGCKKCGSVPSGSSPNGADGLLTVNWVKDACCQGNCHC
ncbi:hypothetical protein PT974_06963 [Cladobotryum mycophilum]|uniref:Killer toxin Kp4 domain-containing protein n=1 Tax=Cladobotryum mycophilum TaxID=491253 RepID=A0ABR0SP45_9HYPO